MKQGVFMKPGSSIIATALLLLICGCGAPGVGSSSRSIAEAEARGILIAEYAIPTHAEIGGYRPLEVWIEGTRRLVVRLKGPHVDSEPRVNVRGLTEHDYRSIWSERNGPPYEVWLAPDPVPETIVLERGNEFIELDRRR